MIYWQCCLIALDTDSRKREQRNSRDHQPALCSSSYSPVHMVQRCCPEYSLEDLSPRENTVNTEQTQHVL